MFQAFQPDRVQTVFSEILKDGFFTIVSMDLEKFHPDSCTFLLPS
jgi:hypothetical protein